MFDVWKNVLAEIEQEIPQTHFTTWFDRTSLVSIEDEVAIIGAPNAFKVKQLEKKYTDKIMTALKNNGVKFKRVEFIIQNTPNKVRKAPGVELMDTAAKRRVSRIAHINTEKINNSALTTNLNSKYTMDNFVTGSNNELAVSVANAVIEAPGEKYNPFFLYGGPGLGKTHLVQAVGNELIRRNPKLKVLYTPINHFYTEFIDAVQRKGMEAFRKKFQKLDVLIIDDFQFIVNKEKSQEEFFNIFNDMHQANKQIIVTSDRLPEQIKTVDMRLASRLKMGGAIDLQMPSFEDRCAILKSKAEFMGVEIEPEAVEYLAENVKTNIRELEGEFSKLLALADLKGVTPLTLINDGFVSTSPGPQGKTVSPKYIVERTAKYYQLSVKELCSKSRVSHIKTARQVAMYLLSEELQMSTPKIALEVGVKDHTTVMHGIKVIKQDLKLNFDLRDQIAAIREKIYE